MFEHRYDLKIKIINKDVYEYYKNIVNTYENKYKYFSLILDSIQI